MDVLESVFEGVFRLANTDLNILGFDISPLDFWLSTAILYMLVDLLFWTIGWDDRGGE